MNLISQFLEYNYYYNTQTPPTMNITCNHTPVVSKMSYLAAHEEAERRLKEGQKQKKCPECNLYFFPDEYGEEIKPLTFVNIPERIYLSPSITEDLHGEQDFQSIDHEFTYWGEIRTAPSDLEYVLLSKAQGLFTQEEVRQMLIEAWNDGDTHGVTNCFDETAEQYANKILPPYKQ